MRIDTLRGTHIVFSSVIPLDMRPETSEIWKTAQAFGAECSTELSNKTTHVVANKVSFGDELKTRPVLMIELKRGTAKVDAARRRGGIQIVWLPWFTDSIALWQRQDERPYLLDEPIAPAPGPGPSSSPVNDSSQMGSSDLDLDTDWDEDDGDHDLVTPAGGNTPSGTGPNTPSKPEVLTNEVAWEDVDAEVEAAMNESDTEDGESNGGGDDVMRSNNVSDDDTDDSHTRSVAHPINTALFDDKCLDLAMRRNCPQQHENDYEAQRPQR
jgi:RNA polymerase II subunit A-like phosphatase